MEILNYITNKLKIRNHSPTLPKMILISVGITATVEMKFSQKSEKGGGVIHKTQKPKAWFLSIFGRSRGAWTALIGPVLKERILLQYAMVPKIAG